MPKNLSPEEIINNIEKFFNDAEQKEIAKIMFRAEHTIESSQLLNKLIEKGIFCISDKPFIEYRLTKYFEHKNIEKISQKKDVIISHVPNLDGLHRGKSASYEDLVQFVSAKYPAEMLDFLSEVKIYDFTPEYKKNGYVCTLYFNRKHNLKANYKYDSRLGHYILKDDDVYQMLKNRGINITVQNPDELFFSMPVTTKKICKYSIFQIALLVIFWPVGLYVLFKNYRGAR